jgi:hypothetical protein
VVGAVDLFNGIDSVANYDFAFLSETPNSSDYKPFLGHPLPLLISEPWATAKQAVLNWSTYSLPVTNAPVVTSRIMANAPAVLTGGLEPGTEFYLVTNTTDTATLAATIGFLPTIPYIPVAQLTSDTLLGELIAAFSVDSSAIARSGGLLTAACAVDRGTLLADGVTPTLNRAYAIGIHAFAYQYLTPQAWDLIFAGIEWITNVPPAAAPAL